MTILRRILYPPRPASLKWRCIWLTAATLVLLAMYIGSSGRTIGVSVGRYEARLRWASLVIGQASDSLSQDDVEESERSIFGFVNEADDYMPYSNAWRPFHATSTGVHALVIPLWQPLILTTALAAFGWGLLRGSHRADPLRCRGCGYSLIGLPETADQRCPECGREVTAEVVATPAESSGQSAAP